MSPKRPIVLESSYAAPGTVRQMRSRDRLVVLVHDSDWEMARAIADDYSHEPPAQVVERIETAIAERVAQPGHR